MLLRLLFISNSAVFVGEGTKIVLFPDVDSLGTLAMPLIKL